MDLTPEQFERAQPPFKSSHNPDPGQKGDGLMIHADGLLPASVPGQRIVGSLRDPENPGHRVQISVPHLPYERWIDEAGNVLSAAIRTNRVQRKRGGSVDDGNFKAQMEKERLKAGWVRYDDGLGKPQHVGDWTPEARDKLIKQRRKEQGDMMAYEAKPWLDKMKKESLEVQKALTDALSTFAEGAKDRSARAAKRAELDK